MCVCLNSMIGARTLGTRTLNDHLGGCGGGAGAGGAHSNPGLSTQTQMVP